MRLISHTESNALLDCEARWDFSYGSTLAGSSLTTRLPAVRLREGRAWGRAVAAFHEAPTDFAAITLGHAALQKAIGDDVAEIDAAGGVILVQDVQEMRDRLGAIFAHYAETSGPRLRLTDPEQRLEVGIPSRTGRRSSSRYRFQALIDGAEQDDDGRWWIVEFKLRGELSTYERLALDRQGRRYAWAWARATGREPAGIVYDERLNAAPKKPKVLKNGEPSTDKRQMTTPELYREACALAHTDPDPETLQAFSERRWQQRQRIIFRPGELAEAGAELVAIARRIADLEGGRLPVRAPATQRCRSCPFRDICPDPTSELVDAQFLRRPAKRDREEIAA